MIIEIRAGEGGKDAAIFVAELAIAYGKLALRQNWKYRASVAPDLRAGHQLLTLTIEGKGAEKLSNEAGAHRLQRVSPTETRGRVHSSTVTVAVLDGNKIVDETFIKRSQNDFIIEWYSGTGCGGQHRNKHMNSARITHVPTGIVKTAQTRSRENSLKSAMSAINEELDRLSGNSSWQKQNDIRKEQVGTGERSDKRRTIRFQDDMVIDHITGKRCTSKEYMKGNMDKVW